MDTYITTFTAKPLKGGWYAIFKNWIPLSKNTAGIGYSNPARKRRERILKTKNPKKTIYSLSRQERNHVRQ